MQCVRIGRITRCNYNEWSIVGIRAGCFAQSFDGVRQRKLCAGESAHEVSTTHLAAKFEALEFLIYRAPGYRRSFATPPIARNDSVAIEPHAGNRGCAILIVDGGAQHTGLAHQRPSSGPRG